ncbi:MAG: glycosyltransferase [Clostridium sp.]|nr:glycosyltransferase [Clostridium sp.]
MNNCDKMTSIVILSYNNLKYTKSCIDSIRKYTKLGRYEIIVIDNNSNDGTIQWLKNQEDIKTIFNDKNLGFPKGCNQGIKIAIGENILLLNNDVIATPNWLKNLRIALYSNKEIGAVGAITNFCSYYQMIQTGYKNNNELIEFAKKNNISDSKKWEERIKLVGFCMLIKKNVIGEIGLLDERFTPGNFEDDDYSFRIRQAGYKLLLCKDTFVHHFGSTSFRQNISDYSILLNTNKEKFKKKWGFDPIYSSGIRYDILGLIDDKSDSLIRVLEIGCACGGTLLEIKNRYKNAELHGIELNENSANISKLIADVKAENVENENLSYDENYFDYIIFGDVLEHLYNPCKVLKNIKKYLKEDGKILSSIPNVMHYSVIRGLLNGRWNYEDAGILDRTHIRFFTLYEINDMFIKAGYELNKISANVIPKTKNDEEFVDKLSNILNPKVKDQFNVYQYIVKAKKKNEKNKRSENADEIKLKFALRRIENNIDIDESKNEIVKMLQNKIFSYEEVIEVVKNDIIKKDMVLNEIAVLCYENKFALK